MVELSAFAANVRMNPFATVRPCIRRKFPNFVLFQTFQKLQKMMLKLNFRNCKKLVLTQKPTQKPT